MPRLTRREPWRHTRSSASSPPSRARGGQSGGLERPQALRVAARDRRPAGAVPRLGLVEVTGFGGFWFLGPVLVFGLFPILDIAVGLDPTNPPDIGTPGTAGYCRLIPFQFSPDVGQSYVLCFTNEHSILSTTPAAHPIRMGHAGFVETGGGATYDRHTVPRSGSAGACTTSRSRMSCGLPAAAIPRKKLTRLADNNWTLADISSTPPIAAPRCQSVTVSAAPSGVSPAPTVTTRYMYCVSAIDADGAESLPSIHGQCARYQHRRHRGHRVAAVGRRRDGAPTTRCGRHLPAHGDKIPLMSEQFGFAGYAYGTVSPTVISPPISQGPDPAERPVCAGHPDRVRDQRIPERLYAWRTVDRRQRHHRLGRGRVSGARSNTPGAAGGIVGLYIHDPGRDYTAPTMTATGAGSGFAATGTVGPTSGLEPSAVGLFQQTSGVRLDRQQAQCDHC